MTRILGAVTVVIIAACVGCGGSGAPADKNTPLANICSAIPDSVVTAALNVVGVASPLPKAKRIANTVISRL